MLDRLASMRPTAVVLAASLLALGGCGNSDETTTTTATTTTTTTTPATGDQPAEADRPEPDVGIVEAEPGERLDPADRWSDLLADASTCPNQRRTDASSQVLERAATCLVNQARLERGLPALTRSPQLDASARRKQRDLVRCDEFSHTACGRRVSAPVVESGYTRGCRSWRMGENLGLGGGPGGSPRSVVLGWLRSPGHRRNLLDPEWTTQGMAVAALDTWMPAYDDTTRSFDDALVWVNHFGRRDGC